MIDKLEGWFDFHDVYEQAVRDAPEDGAIWVEIGVAFGKSAAFLAREIKKSGKRGSFYAIDPWDAPVNGAEDRAEVLRLAEMGGPFNAFLKGMREWARDELERMQVLRLPSVQAARLFDPATIDFVFIDGSHRYEDVRADIAAWRPLVKPGGVLAGHDYQHPGVQPAVHEAFGALAPCGNLRWPSWKVRL